MAISGFFSRTQDAQILVNNQALNGTTSNTFGPFLIDYNCVWNLTITFSALSDLTGSIALQQCATSTGTFANTPTGAITTATNPISINATPMTVVFEGYYNAADYKQLVYTNSNSPTGNISIYLTTTIKR